MAFPATIHSGGNASNPAKDCILVTRSNTLNVFGGTYNTTNGGDRRACRGLLVGTGGAQSLVMATGEIRVDVPLQAGYNPLEVIQVLDSGTKTAANIWALI